MSDFSVVQNLHFIGFAVSIGTIAIVDFRLSSDDARLPPNWPPIRAVDAGWYCRHVLITGPLMFSTDAVAY